MAPVSAIVAVIGEGVISEAKSLDPYNEVHTPPRNFGPATISQRRKGKPLARRVAFEAGVDLTTVKGSGPHGRIHAATDVKAFRAPNRSANNRCPIRTYTARCHAADDRAASG